MMEEYLCPPVTVEGDWTPAQTRTLKNKLQLYFGSKKKSNGGDCRVELDDGAPTAAVYFRSEEVRQRVLEKENHEIILENKTIKLRLVSASSPKNSDDVSDSSTDSKTQKSEVEPGNGASAENKEGSESVQSVAVVLDNVSDKMSRDLLSMLVENISGLDESSYSLEIIWETNQAVVTFSSPADVEKFLTVSQNSQKLEKHELTARPLEAAKSVRVESLPPTVVKDLLELYFEKNWSLPDHITMIPDEQAAIVTFNDPKVVESICIKEDYVMRSIPVKVYPYYESLGTALYGKERPTWKMPEPFTECVHHAVWKFLLMKNLIKSINEQMRPYFCSVDLDNPEVKLSPLPSFLRQKDLTAEHVDNWMSTAQKAFRQQMAHYTAFECPMNAPAWETAENDVRSFVREDAALVLDASREILTVAGQADKIKQIRAPVESIVLKAMNQIEQCTNGVSESPTNSDDVSGSESVQSVAVVLNNVSDKMSRDLLSMLVENISGLDESSYSLEIIWETNQAVVTFSSPADVEKFLTVSQNSQKLEKHELTARPLEAAKSVRVESLPPTVVKDLLELYFEKNWSLPDHITMIPDEQAAIVTFNDPKVVESICIKEDYVMRSIPVKVYPYYESLGTALYGKERPTWKMPEPFTECVHHAVWKFLLMKKQLKSINEQMRPYFCSVDLDNPEVKLSPLPSFLRQKDLTAEHVDNWMSTAQKAFRQQMAHYTAFECPANAPAWKAVEKEVCSVVREDAALVLDTSRGTLTVAGQADNIKQIRAPVESIVLKAMNQIEQRTNSVSEVMNLSPAMFYILKQDGLQKAALDISPEMSLSYTDDTHKLTISGLPAEVFKTKSWILERNVRMSKKQLDIPPRLLDFLRTVDPMDMSQDMFTSQGISAIYSVESKGVFLLGSSDRALDDAESKIKMALSFDTLDVEDHGVLKLHNWVDLNQKLLDTYNSSKKRTVDIQFHSERRDKVTVAGLLNPVKEVSRSLKEFIVNYSQVQETFRVESFAVVLFMEKKKSQDCSNIAKDYDVTFHYDSERPQIIIAGARLHVQKAKSCFKELTSALFTDNFIVDKPGAKKYFQSQGSLFLSKLMTEFSCMVVLHSENQEEEEEENYDTVSVLATAVNKEFIDLEPTMTIPQQAGRRVRRSLRDNMEIKQTRSLLRVDRLFGERGEGGEGVGYRGGLLGNRGGQSPRGHAKLRGYGRLMSIEKQTKAQEQKTVLRKGNIQDQTCFSRQFRGETGPRNIQHEAQDFNESPVWQSLRKSQQSSASFGQVSSPSLGVYRMQMGQLTLEVSSGDITKETSDVIINSSNTDFTLKSGVSKAILDSAGLQVELECSQIVNSPGYQPRPMIVTSAGLLPSKNIIHIVGQTDPANIKEVVYSVLKVCEDNKFSSVSFPALGTGQGGANPSAVADAMVGAVVEFVRKTYPRFVQSVKILIFQTAMVMEFHKSMKKRQGEDVEKKSVLTKLKETVTTFLTVSSEERLCTDRLVLEKEEFEPTVFQLCADNAKAVSQVKKRIEELILAEQAKRTFTDPYFSQLSQADMEELKALQRNLTVSIRLDRSLEDQEPTIHLEGLTRDVMIAESSVRDIIRRVERTENERHKALLVSGLVEWQFQHRNGKMVPFDIYTNLNLEKALEKKQRNVTIKINNQIYTADLMFKRAVSTNGREQLELLRKDLKADDGALPSHWDDMKGDLMKLFPLTVGSKEYGDVEKEFQKTGLYANIISIERVQNETLRQSYQLKKKQLEAKNKHKNNEQMLFHGTGSDSIDLINKQGFNRSYAGAHGAMYGNGSYFAVDPAYSARGYARPDARGQKRMYLARVLVGDFVQGRSGMITPPPRGSGNASDLYDSVTDNPARPTMFVIFNDIQAYPEYLITFT
ncbi:protein mono-ADP-ribosyltransferase PARP14-like isoform X1 [Thunnus thynnus]|uniref:protein mono-ADP-ribosyltransferase PARP14-like isoform X1 n=1 Tax=Thunnus thynnus TaxID=8237 RepID=UPI003529AAFC